MPNNKENNDLALYQDFDLKFLDEDIEATKEAQSANRKFVRLEQGKTVLRVLPPKRGTSYRVPWRPVWRHFIEIPGLEKKLNIICPAFTAKSPCPVCAVQRDREQSSNPVDRKFAEAWKAQRSLMAAVLLRAAPEQGIKPWEFKVTIHRELQSIIGESNFAHPGHGIDLVIHRSGEGLKTQYKVKLDPRGPSPLVDDADQMTELLKSIPDLDELCQPDSAEAIQDMLDGELGVRRASGRGVGPRSGGRTAADRIYDGRVVDNADE
jgi:hypothetical protein